MVTVPRSDVAEAVDSWDGDALATVAQATSLTNHLFHALNSEPTEPLGKGVWCHGCDWFENDEREGDMCVACGCPTDDHVDAQVVAIAEQ